VGTLVASILHSATSYEKIPALLTIILPALGGAFTGISNHREHNRQSRRYGWMATMMRDTRHAIERADDLATVAAAARRAARLAVSENDEWVEMMSFHGVDIPS
jgi:hypothetical protein